MRLYFYGGAKTVTGANYILEIEDPSTSLPPEARLAKGGRTRIMVDCGLFQGTPEIEKRNYEPFPYNPKEVDFVLITHAHLDHIGRLPKLIKEGFKGKIFATGPTIDFTRLMLEDSGKVLEEKAAKAGIIPIFADYEVEETMSRFTRVEYGEPFKLTDDIKVCFRDAGHVLGSAMIEIEISDKRLEVGGKKKIVFTGDLGNDPVPFLKPPAKIKEADYLIIESAYGDRRHESLKHCSKAVENLAEEIAAQKGVLMIPSFALERTQQLLYLFNHMVEQHKIPRMPIFLDSPLAQRITEVYKRYPQYYDEEALSVINSGDDVFKFPGLDFTYTTKQSKQIDKVPGPKIIIAGSGMSQGGRIMHHEAHYLSDPNNILLIVAFQAEGTIGRQILEGAKHVEILDQKIPVRAKVEHINGYSGHADAKQLFDFVKPLKHSLKKVFIVQGEEKPASALAQKIRDHLGIPVEVPEVGYVAELH
jgi:metallo-beta-lactamase family protein